MRIIAGTAGGRKITVPKGPDVRPTTDRVREALFSSLADAVDEARVLDLFGGSGALGLESLSRGAASVLFVERSRGVAANLKKNIAELGFTKEATVAMGDGVAFAKKQAPQTFDLVFVDPPYDTGLLEKALDAIVESNLLSEDGLIIAEHPGKTPPPIPETLQVRRTKRYGNTTITTLERNHPQES